MRPERASLHNYSSITTSQQCQHYGLLAYRTHNCFASICLITWHDYSRVKLNLWADTGIISASIEIIADVRYVPMKIMLEMRMLITYYRIGSTLSNSAFTEIKICHAGFTNWNLSSSVYENWLHPRLKYNRNTESCTCQLLKQKAKCLRSNAMSRILFPL